MEPFRNYHKSDIGCTFEEDGKMKRSILVMLTFYVVLGFSVNTYADLFDGFEDGDTTNNPTWTVTNPVGTHSVVSDPYRTGNLVLSVIGTNTAHRELYTQVNMLTNGFRFEVEYAASSSADQFNLILALDGEDDFILRTMIASAAWLPSSGGETAWLLAQNPNNSSEWSVQDPSYPVIPSQPLGEWWKIALWNEPSTETVIGEIRKVSDNSLVWTRTVSFPSISSNEYIHGVRLAIEETDWQYLDNISLVPTPGAVILGSIGLTFSGWLCRRKRT